MFNKEVSLWRQGSFSGGGNNRFIRGEDCFVAKEHMFDKVVTPSDVGKLNRLVIPKQYAEKYLPLDKAEAGGKGLLLSFEDRTGKSWRFRYSYWSSSQSYVMTKGWSRFVKEKGLGAGDTVSFARGVGDDGARRRLFIDYMRRQPENGSERRHPLPGLTAAYLPPPAVGLIVPPQGHSSWRVRTSAAASDAGSASRQLLYFRLPVAKPPQMEVQRVPVAREQAAGKRVRLFGVNLDFPEAGENGSWYRSQSRGADEETLTRKEVQSTLDPRTYEK